MLYTVMLYSNISQYLKDERTCYVLLVPDKSCSQEEYAQDTQSNLGGIQSDDSLKYLE